MRRLVASIVFVILSQVGAAQILNVEKDRIEQDTSRVWLGSANLTFNLRKQQVDVLTLTAFSNTVRLTDQHSYMLISNMSLIKVSGAQVISDGYAHLRANLMRKHKLSYELFTQKQYDQSRGMRNRELAGAGVRYKLLSNNRFTLAVGSGAMYEYEVWHFEQSDSTTRLIKSTNYATLHAKISQHIEANIIGYYQARFDWLDQPRLIADANILVSINKHFSFTTRIITFYDASPVVPVNRFIYSLTNGLALKF